MLTKTRDIDIDIDWVFAYVWHIFVCTMFVYLCVYAVGPKVNPFRHFRTTKQNVTNLFNQISIYQFQFSSHTANAYIYVFIWVRSTRKYVHTNLNAYTPKTHKNTSCSYMYKIWVSSSVKYNINYVTMMTSMR